MEKFNTESELEGLLSRYEGRTFVILFGAEWCDPCKRVRQTMTEAEKRYSDRFIFCECDVDIAESSIVETYRFSSIPTLFIISDRMIVKRIVGDLGIEKLSIILDND